MVCILLLSILSIINVSLIRSNVLSKIISIPQSRKLSEWIAGNCMKLFGPKILKANDSIVLNWMTDKREYLSVAINVFKSMFDEISTYVKDLIFLPICHLKLPGDINSSVAEMNRFSSEWNPRNKLVSSVMIAVLYKKASDKTDLNAGPSKAFVWICFRLHSSKAKWSIRSCPLYQFISIVWFRKWTDCRINLVAMSVETNCFIEWEKWFLLSFFFFTEFQIFSANRISLLWWRYRNSLRYYCHGSRSQLEI